MLGGVQWHGVFSVPAKGANFVKTSDVVDVIMSVEDMIDLGYLSAKSLLAKIGASIDEEMDLVAFEVDGGPSPAIAGIGGGADGALTADYRHSNGGGRS